MAGADPPNVAHPREIIAIAPIKSAEANILTFVNFDLMSVSIVWFPPGDGRLRPRNARSRAPPRRSHLGVSHQARSRMRTVGPLAPRRAASAQVRRLADARHFLVSRPSFTSRRPPR